MSAEIYKEQWEKLIDAPVQPKPDSLGPLRWKSTSRSIKPGHTFQLPIHVQEAGSEILFEFHTDSYDIEFEVSFTPFGEKGQLLEDEDIVMLEKYRMNAHEEAVRNSLIVDSPGVVILTWDNAYSWVTGKTLSYSVKLVLPRATSEDLGHQEFFSRKLQECAAKASNMRKEYKELKGTSAQLEAEINGLEAQLLEIQERLQTKKEKLQALGKRSESVHQELKTQQQNVNGLFVRSLTDVQATHFVSFFPAEDALNWSMASKEWNSRLREGPIASSTSKTVEHVAQPISVQPEIGSTQPSVAVESLPSESKDLPQVEVQESSTPVNQDFAPACQNENEDAKGKFFFKF